MKLSLIACAALLASFAVGCGTSDDSTDQGQPPAGDQPPTDQPAKPEPRKLVDGTQMSTSPVNLLVDPGFGLVGQQAGVGAFFTFYDNSQDQLELVTQIDSRSPAGFGGAVALVKPAGATDKKSEPVMVMTSFLGGQGPFHAQVWISKSDVKGNPVDLPLDGSAVKISIAADSPDSNTAFDLKPVDGASRTFGGRTWTLYKADITSALTYGGFFVLHTGSKGGFIHIAAPEVTSDQIQVGQAVLSRNTAFLASARSRTALESAGIAKYKSIKPKLVPASQTKPRVAF